MNLFQVKRTLVFAAASLLPVGCSVSSHSSDSDLRETAIREQGFPNGQNVECIGQFVNIRQGKLNGRVSDNSLEFVSDIRVENSIQLLVKENKVTWIFDSFDPAEKTMYFRSPFYLEDDIKLIAVHFDSQNEPSKSYIHRKSYYQPVNQMVCRKTY